MSAINRWSRRTEISLEKRQEVCFLHTPSSNPSVTSASPKYFPNLFTFLHLHCFGYSAHHHLNSPGLFYSNWPSCLPNPPVASYITQADPELLQVLQVLPAARFPDFDLSYPTIFTSVKSVSSCLYLNIKPNLILVLVLA